LILADAIHYTCKIHNPASIVELSTLTGAIVVALGSRYSGIFTKDDTLANALINAGKETEDELFWRMPMDDAYLKLIQSNVADLKNAGSREAGSCSAAIFLNQFVSGGIPFCHVDIAGLFKGILMNRRYACKEFIWSHSGGDDGSTG
jgi:leucyl aminopeptidase